MNKKINLILAMILISCAEDGRNGSNGSNGINGQPCIAINNGDGSYTISCPNSEPITIKNGENGRDGTNGINGENGTNGNDGMDGVNGTNGENGMDGTNGTSCRAMQNPDQSYPISCPDSEPIVIKNGKDGASCELRANADGTYQLQCPNADPITLNPNQTTASQGDCQMNTHNGVMSISLEGSCQATMDLCDGVVFSGSGSCADQRICCISGAQIALVQDQTLRSNGDPAPCTQNNGFCVDTNQNPCTEVANHQIQSGLCPGPANILCCQPN